MLRTATARRWIFSALALAAVAPLVRADTTVNFGFQWIDYSSGGAHPLQSMPVSFYDALNGGPAGVSFAGPLPTDANGQLTLLTNYANVDASNNLQIQPVIVATINGVGSAYLNS